MRTGEDRRAISEDERDAQERVSPEPRRKGRSHGWAEAQAGESLLRHSYIEYRIRTGEDRRASSEEERDARERGRSEPRRKGRSHGGAAPLPNELRSLGYPATNSPRGKAQAGDPLLRHQLN
jgi:hypothetical protein